MASENHIDKEWDSLWKELESVSKDKSFHERTNSLAKTKNFSSSDFGIGASMMGKYADPVQGLKSSIFAGHGHIEFSPTISGQGADFGKIGKERREAIKELAKINKTTVATHANANIAGMTGFDPRQGIFSDELAEMNKQEVKKAIEFAADIEQGGGITFHAGEFLRPLQDQNGGNEFSQSEEELDKLQLSIVDSEHKQILRNQAIQVGDRVSAPVFDTTKKIKIEGLDDVYINELKEENGQPVWKNFNNFKEYTAFLLETDDDFKKAAQKELGAKYKDLSSYVKTNANSKQKEVSDYYLMELAAKTKIQNDYKLKIAQNANQQLLQINRQLREIEKVKDAIDIAKERVNKGEGSVYVSQNYMRGTGKLYSKEQIDDLKKRGFFDEEDYIEIKKGDTSFEEKYVETRTGEYRIGQLQDYANQIKIQNEETRDSLKQLNKKIGEDFQTVSHFAQQTAAKNYAELAMEAYYKTQEMKKKNPHARDIHLAIENLFPERFGSHPEELLQVINNARAAFKEQIKAKVKDEKKATEIANNTIKATFDTGHLNMWKKHFRYKEGESTEERDKKFQKWALEQTKKLVDANVIGNIHMADNFGYGDDHLAVGQGNVPIKEYMELFDRAKAEGKITGKIAVEGGFDENQDGVHEAWKQTGVQVFRSLSATEQWVNPESRSENSFGYQHFSKSYLGNYNKPAFIFGKYSPDQNEWGPWSETTLE